MAPLEYAIAALVIAPLAVIAWAIWTYNRLIRLRNLVEEAWSGIDVQLRRRHDLIPGLVATVEAYRDFERDVLRDVTQARSDAVARGDAGPTGGRHGTRLQDAENNLTRHVRSLFALVEAYPDLKADRRFADLHTQLIETEDLLQHARRYYNGAVRDYNTLVASFPPLMIAPVLGFEPKAYFQIEPALGREAPKVALAGDQSQ